MNEVDALEYLMSKDDKFLLKLYRSTRFATAMLAFLSRHERLIIKIAFQWLRWNRHIIKYMDVYDEIIHAAYFAVIESVWRIHDIDSIKNIGSRMHSYIYNELNRVFKYKRYETGDLNTGVYYHSNMRYKGRSDVSDTVDILPVLGTPAFYVYYYGYNIFKVAIMFCNSRSNKYMSLWYHRNKLSKWRRKYE